MMQADMGMTLAPEPIQVRSAGMAEASDRWGRLAFAAALAFVANLYASPVFFWPGVFEPLRLGVVTSGLCAFAVLMRRLTSGERLRVGGFPVAFLFAYAAVIPLSMAWTISPDRTLEAVSDIAKLLLVAVALVNALDTPGRLHSFLLVGALATLAPSLGAISRWVHGERLVDGYRTAWEGNYADPNRLAMGLVLFLPAAMTCIAKARRLWLKALLAFAAVASIAAIVLTHSRSGAVGLVLAILFVLLRGRSLGRGLVLGALVAAALGVLAPRSFWTRSESIANYGEDVSFAHRERAWSMLQVIASERPFTGVGAGAFIDAWDRFAPLSAGGEHLIAHNILMEIQGELGAIALALFGVYSLWLTVRLFRAGSSGDSGGGVEARAIFAGLSGYLVCELVNGYTRAFGLYCGFGMGMAAIALSRVRSQMAAAEKKLA